MIVKDCVVYGKPENILYNLLYGTMEINTCYQSLYIGYILLCDKLIIKLLKCYFI